MALNKKPVTGMKDIMPEEMQIRDYVINVIKETYGKFGFTPMETPCMENIENLSSKQGGENEKLIFKILKRGEKLNLESAQSESDVVDFGMRYDLTVPLVRYYSNQPMSCLPHSRHCRLEMYGGQTSHRRADTASLCSATSTYSARSPISRKLS